MTVFSCIMHSQLNPTFFQWQLLSFYWLMCLLFLIALVSVCLTLSSSIAFLCFIQGVLTPHCIIPVISCYFFFSFMWDLYVCFFFLNQNLHSIELSMEAILNLEFSSAGYIHAAVKKMIRNVQFCKFEDLYPPNNSHATFPMWFLLGNWHNSWPFFQAPHSCF